MVTGGAGFIGSAVCRYLVRETEAQVVNIDKLTYAANLRSLETIAGSPRYSRALAQNGSAQGFAEELQRAGYATDPAYADKLGRVINTTLRLQRSLA